MEGIRVKTMNVKRDHLERDHACFHLKQVVYPRGCVLIMTMEQGQTEGIRGSALFFLQDGIRIIGSHHLIAMIRIRLNPDR